MNERACFNERQSYLALQITVAYEHVEGIAPLAHKLPLFHTAMPIHALSDNFLDCVIVLRTEYAASA